MNTQLASFSANMNGPCKIQKKSLDHGSHSSKSDRFLSASKSNRAFEESLRNPDSNSKKPEDYSSPLKKKLLFGKVSQQKFKENKPTFFIDLTKKIRKVESPFAHSESACGTQEKNLFSQTQMPVSCFDSISQKIEDQAQSSHSIEKIVSEPQETQFKKLALEIKDVIQNFNIEDSKVSQVSQGPIQIMVEESQQRSSNDVLSLKSKSSELMRLRKKEKKIRKKRDKVVLARKIKQKLHKITEFVDQLHKKESHTNRKELIEQLSRHLCQEKFSRLRNQLKKLI